MVKRRKRSNAFEQFSGDSKRFRNESILHQDDTENSVPENSKRHIPTSLNILTIFKYSKTMPDSHVKLPDMNFKIVSEPLYGREKEVALLEKPLHEGIVNRSPASIFVSGPPGTGKTLAVKTVLQHMLSQHK